MAPANIKDTNMQTIMKIHIGSQERATQTALEPKPTKRMAYKTAPAPPKYPAINMLGKRNIDMKIRLAKSCPTNKLTFNASASFCGKSPKLTDSSLEA
jgi:hypothetical protein